MCDLSTVPWHASRGSQCMNWLQMVGAAIDRCGRRRLVFTSPLSLSYHAAPKRLYGIGLIQSQVPF